MQIGDLATWVSAVATWGSAVATFAAAGVALWFGLSEARKRESERSSLGRIHLWVVVAEVGPMASALIELCSFCQRIRELDIGTHLQDGDRSYLRELGRMVAGELLNRHLAALACLDPSIGEPLARLAGRAGSLRYQISVIAEETEITPQLHKLVLSWERQAKLMLDDINQSGLMTHEQMQNELSKGE
ncbi:hypothetical protein [Bordetella sp. LUAb4]|uniref:hypothetical protein n=1 Tax=Bordetella sp. LUAb4 TaxID=2843195 RepID=UPI001E476D91|nr:hypothetical protein [Bordetella sp. LUAb4]